MSSDEDEGDDEEEGESNVSPFFLLTRGFLHTYWYTGIN